MYGSVLIFGQYLLTEPITAENNTFVLKNNNNVNTYIFLKR